MAGTFNTLYSFTSTARDCGPTDTLATDAAGSLYGTTRSDGQNGHGSVFELTPFNGGWTYTWLHDFSGADVDSPNRVILDARGDLYGTTYSGAAYGNGVVFEITP